MKFGITMIIHNKDDIQFVTEFPCFLGNPVLPWKPALPGVNPLILEFLNQANIIPVDLPSFPIKI